HQVVVALGPVFKEDAPRPRVDTGDLRHQYRRVLLPAKNAPNRPGDVRWRQRRGRHLVQKRLEKMMILLVDQQDASVCVLQGPRRTETAEPAADDDDPWPGTHFSPCRQNDA